MMIQNLDSTIIEAPRTHSLPQACLWDYRVEVSADMLDEQGSMIDWLIGFAFDILGAIHLDVRVHPTDCWPTTTRPGPRP